MMQSSRTCQEGGYGDMKLGGYVERCDTEAHRPGTSARDARQF